MSRLRLLHGLNPPEPGDPAAARRGLDDWRRLGEPATDPKTSEILPICREISETNAGRKLLLAIFGNSPYLSHCLLLEPHILARFLTEGPEAVHQAILDEGSDTILGSELGDDEVAVALRVAKRRASLLIALADITGVWSTERAAAAVSEFADHAIDLAARHLLRDGIAKKQISLNDETRDRLESGWIILGMGKLGGGELNYSSDIDLIVLFDDAKVTYTGRRDIQNFFVRLTQRLIRLLDERTADGYVFRTDMRLRPDPGVTQVAVSIQAAGAYYQTTALQWERAAMIKARPVAGDLAAGKAFLDTLVPFVWRRHLDFPAIRDIRAIKHQIEAHHGGGEIAVHGHNIKLGRGGIREIEFLVQTHQMIWGGQQPDLRVRPTTAALAALRDNGRINPSAEMELREAYWFLRRVEHRLQMVDDRQTQTLPDTDEGIERLATFLGYSKPTDFVDELLGTHNLVSRYFNRLFDEMPELTPPIPGASSLVFSGPETGAETLKTLENMGFRQTENVAATIRGWFAGRIRATRSDDAGAVLARLVPDLLDALSETADPDGSFARFDAFLSRLPPGVQILSLFETHPFLLDMIALIMGQAPSLATDLNDRPRLLETVLSDDFVEPLPELAVLEQSLESELGRATDYQDILDFSRRWAADFQFKTAIQELRGTADGAACALARTNLADLTIAAIVDATQGEFARRYGRIAGACFAVVGLGKLGARAMTRDKSVDLVFLYRRGVQDQVSDGGRKLDAANYFGLLAQRVITALAAKTPEGYLYETRLDRKLLTTESHMVCDFDEVERFLSSVSDPRDLEPLTRARVIVAEPDFATEIEQLFQRFSIASG